MAGIGGIGVNTSASVYGVVQQLMALERVELNRLEDQKAEHRQRGMAFTDLGGMLRDLRSAADDFRWGGTLSPINSFAAESSDESIARVSADAHAADGVHTVSVAALARAHSLASDQLAGEETFGQAGARSFEIVQDGETFLVSVTVEEGDTNRDVLVKVVNALNESAAAVTASLVTTTAGGDGQRILLTSQTSGTAGLISEIRDTWGDLAAEIGLAGSSAQAAYSANTVQEAADAVFSLDGLEFVSGSNHVADAVAGVTLDLVGVSESQVTLTIERDVEAVREGIDELISKYNTVVDYVRGKTRGADSEGENRGLLTSNTLFTTLRQELRGSIVDAVPDPLAQGRLERLSQIGITADRQGRLTVSDSNAFEDALRLQPSEVERLFTDPEEGVAARLAELMDSHVRAGGLLDTQRQIARARDRILDARIEREEANLERREEQLIEQYAALENTMSQLQRQRQILESMGLS